MPRWFGQSSARERKQAQRQAWPTTRQNRPAKSGLFFQAIQVAEQFFVVGHAAEVPADHFVSSQRRLTARPETNQHARDDRAIHLNFDAVLRTTQQVPTARAIAWCLPVENDFFHVVIIPSGGESLVFDAAPGRFFFL